jgi:hypothetical protein
MSFDLFVIHKFNAMFADVLESTAGSHVTTMFLTVAQKPPVGKEFEQEVQLIDGPVGKNTSEIAAWLKRDEVRPRSALPPVTSSLDGAYLQFEPSMLEPAGLAELTRLAEQFTVGVWGRC